MGGGKALSQPVSIICPYRNAATFIPSLIATVQQQTHEHWELLLIDDCSADAGPYLVDQAASKDRRIRPLSVSMRSSGAPTGPWWPRNMGMSNAKHDLVAFLDVDDLWHPLKLQRQLSWHLGLRAALSVTAYAKFHKSTGAIIGWRVPPRVFDYSRLRLSNVVPMLSVLVDKSVLLGEFRPCPHEDYLFWLDILRANPTARCIGIPELLAFYSVHPGNLTRSRWQMPFWTYQVYRSHGLGVLNSASALIPWAMLHLTDHLRSAHRPLSMGLARLQSAVPPISLAM